MIEIRHEMPGRLRLRVPDIERQPALATALSAALAQEPGVRQVRANAACGSLVVGYEPGRLECRAVAARVRDLLHGARPEGLRLAGFQSAAPRLPNATTTPRRRFFAGFTRPLTRPASASAPRTTRSPRRRPAGAGHGARGVAAPPCRLCRLHARLTGWMLRTTLRCWWNGRLAQPRHARATAAAAPLADSTWSRLWSQVGSQLGFRFEPQRDAPVAVRPGSQSRPSPRAPAALNAAASTEQLRRTLARSPRLTTGAEAPLLHRIRERFGLTDLGRALTPIGPAR